MATLGNIASAEASTPPVGSVDVLIGIAGPVSDEELRSRLGQSLTSLVSELSSVVAGLRVAVAYPGSNGADAANREQAGSSIRFLAYPLSGSGTGALPWLPAVAAYRGIAELAEKTEAKACILLAPDLAAVTQASLSALARPLLENKCVLTMPVYPIGKYEGLLNSSILYPFTRALYGRQIRFPLPVDFGISGKMLSRMAADVASNNRAAAAESIMWPGIEGTMIDCDTVQAHVDAVHVTQGDAVNLTTVISQLAGSLFEGAEKNAAIWQRLRGSQPIPVVGAPFAFTGSEGAVDVKPLIESFLLGSRNLQEVWSLVLPPVALLELKRMARLSPEQFHLPDPLWARIVYDFALAHRLRTLSRTHLLGALTPLYLGWVASYAAEVKSLDASAAEKRIERLAVAFEEAKPYFVSRWRWPDRFNP
ncbi:hypothetical protein ACPOL_5691 [Acidisarcina polymorpha]|uniref:Uncharacterized protein n=1 Tax=Acidisarcina polymorpha TaxID=2211140 RepID=A0A2Z5G7Z4_9BACT|nr:hypothetical protein [Acidisarcina polymorpha]AXC14937.1 hypothetical protein ACPOL_5691 [Acidisarcina polymorpha]